MSSSLILIWWYPEQISILEKNISFEQFDFLASRQILYVVGIAHEYLHLVKSKHLQAFILKMDLDKEYDRVDWTFLIFVLIQIGIQLKLQIGY